MDIIVDSANRLTSSNSSSDFSIKLRSTRIVRRVSFRSITLKFSWSPIDSTNNTLKFNEGAADLTATLSTPNTWTGTDIATSLQNAMNAVSSGFTVSYNSTTFKYTISKATNFTLKFATTGNTIYKILGFNNVDTYTGTNTYTSDNIGYALGFDYVLIKSNALMNSYSSDKKTFQKATTFGNSPDLVLDNSQNIFMAIPVNVGIGSTIIYNQHDFDRTLDYGDSLKTLDLIDIQLLNPWTNNVININGANFMLNLTCEL